MIGCGDREKRESRRLEFFLEPLGIPLQRKRTLDGY